MIDRSCHGHLFIVGETSAECQRQIHDQSRTSKWVYDCISKQTSREQDPAEQTRSRTLGLTREPRPGGPVLFEVAGKTQLADRDPAIEPACPFASTAASPNGSGDDGSGDALRSRPLRRAPAPPYRRRNYPLAAGSQRAQPISIVTHALAACPVARHSGGNGCRHDGDYPKAPWQLLFAPKQSMRRCVANRRYQ